MAVKDLPEGFEIKSRCGRMIIIGNLNPGFYKDSSKVLRYIFVDPGGILKIYRKLRSGEWSVRIYDNFGYWQSQTYTSDPPYQNK